MRHISPVVRILVIVVALGAIGYGVYWYIDYDAEETIEILSEAEVAEIAEFRPEIQEPNPIYVLGELQSVADIQTYEPNFVSDLYTAIQLPTPDLANESVKASDWQAYQEAKGYFDVRQPSEQMILLDTFDAMAIISQNNTTLADLRATGAAPNLVRLVDLSRQDLHTFAARFHAGHPDYPPFYLRYEEQEIVPAVAPEGAGSYPSLRVIDAALVYELLREGGLSDEQIGQSSEDFALRGLGYGSYSYSDYLSSIRLVQEYLVLASESPEYQALLAEARRELNELYDMAQ